MRKAVRAIIVKDDQLLVMHRNKFGDQYYTLIGGAIEMGETPEKALAREVKEETTLNITDHKLIFIEEPGDPFGTQYIYLCSFPGGEISLPPDSIEAKINQMGKNLYSVMWLPINKLASERFRSETLKHALLHSFKQGFPDQPKTLEAGDYMEEAYGA